MESGCQLIRALGLISGVKQERTFSNQKSEIRYIRKIVYGKKRAITYWEITTDPETLPHRRVREDAADHPGAYRDGYREGRKSARNREAYVPRDAGGEFTRGFEDGYYGRHFSGQQYVVRDRVEYDTIYDCNNRRRRDYDSIIHD